MVKARWYTFAPAIILLALAACSTATVSPQPVSTATNIVQPTEVAQPSPTPEPTQPPAVEPTALPQPTEAPSAAPTAPPAEPAAATVDRSGCFDTVLFLADVNFPDFSTVEPDKAFLKTWRVRNAGSCAWDGSYKLTFLSGEPMTDVISVPLPETQPGADVDISVNLTTPAGVGGYTSNWQFVSPDGKVIPLVLSDQAYIWLKINVAQAPPVLVNNPPENVVPVTGPSPQPAPVTSPLPANIPLNCASTGDDAFTSSLLALINAERTSRGVPALTANAQLNAAARTQAMDMSCNNFVEHYGTDGSTWFTRIKAQGYNYAYASENIASGNPAFGGSPEWVIKTLWMNSQVHRDNILNPGVTEIGVAYLFNPAAKWGGYTAVVFAHP